MVVSSWSSCPRPFTSLVYTFPVYLSHSLHHLQLFVADYTVCATHYLPNWSPLPSLLVYASTGAGDKVGGGEGGMSVCIPAFPPSQALQPTFYLFCGGGGPSPSPLHGMVLSGALQQLSGRGGGGGMSGMPVKSFFGCIVLLQQFLAWIFMY
jgi:hypothetical protein